MRHEILDLRRRTALHADDGRRFALTTAAATLRL